MPKNENEVKEKRVRHMVGPFYTSPEIEAAINKILQEEELVEGNAKAEHILSAIQFYREWRGKVNQPKQEIDPEELTRLQNENINLRNQLEEATKANANTDNENIQSLMSANERLDNELKEAQKTIDQLRVEAEQLRHPADPEPSGDINWEQIAETLDPIYADMCVEVAKRIGKGEVSPLMAPIDIFVRYHVLRYTELSFQPFLPVDVINSIVNKHNPSIGGYKGFEKLIKSL